MMPCGDCKVDLCDINDNYYDVHLKRIIGCYRTKLASIPGRTSSKESCEGG